MRELFASCGNGKSPIGELAKVSPRGCACQRTVVAGLSPALSWRGPLGVIDHVIDRSSKFLHARARHDDRVPATVRFFRDPEEFAAVVLAELDVEVLTFDLQLPGLYEVIHLFQQKRRSLGQRTAKRKAEFSPQLNRQRSGC